MVDKRSSKKKKKKSPSACPPTNGKIESPYGNICLLSAVSVMKDGANDFAGVQTGTKKSGFEFNLRQEQQPASSNSEDRSSVCYGNVVSSGLADPTETMKCAPVGISSPYLMQRSANAFEMDPVHAPQSEPLCISSNSMDCHSHQDLRSKDSNFLIMITSPWKYFIGQINGGNSLQSTTLVGGEKKRQRVYNTMFHVPWRCELLIDVGFFVCLDSFLSLLTIMPMRILISLWRFLKNWRLFQRPYADELSDFGCLVVLICGVTLLQLADISLMYHIIRGQGTIKLYVVYNVLEIFDKLCQSFGADVLQVLFNSAEGVASCPGENLTFEIMRFILDQAIAVTAFIVHSFIILAQAITLSAAIISHNNALLALLVSNNFAEIKSNVFKRVGKDNLHKMAYHDTVERFHIMAFILFVLAQNILEADGPWFWSFAKNASLIWLCEILVDVIKHAFLAKFNEIKPAVYSEFLEALCNQTLNSQSHEVHKTLTFVPLAPACAVARVITPLFAARLPYGPFWWRWLLILLHVSVAYVLLATLKVLVGIGLQMHARWYVKRCLTRKRHLHAD